MYICTCSHSNMTDSLINWTVITAVLICLMDLTDNQLTRLLIHV